MGQAKNSDITRKRYDRLAFFYDLFEAPVERMLFSKWRTRLFSRITGKWILEVGVGTGKNLEHMGQGNPILGLMFNMLNPLVVRMMGANINRRTFDNIRFAGWNIQTKEMLLLDIFRYIEASRK